MSIQIISEDETKIENLHSACCLHRDDKKALILLDASKISSDARDMLELNNLILSLGDENI